MRAIQVFATIHTRRRIARIGGVYVVHSFALKALLANLLDNLGYTDAARRVQALPFSNFYAQRWVEEPAPWRDDATSTLVAVGGTAKMLEGYFYVGFDKRLYDALQHAAGYGVDIGHYAGAVKKLYVVDVHGNGQHWQTLLVNPPTRERVECRGDTVKVCHLTPGGTACACQPLSWSGRPPRVLRVETVYGVVENPPAEFPGFEPRAARTARRGAPRRARR